MTSLTLSLGNWTSGRGPLYRQLADRISQLVTDGALRPDESLPPERRLAEDLAVSRSTTVAAYALLAERGVVVRKQGSGTRIAAPARLARSSTVGAEPILRAGTRGTEFFRPLVAEDEDVIDLAAVVLPQAPEVAEVFGSLAGPELDDVLRSGGYMPYGLPLLRRRLAEEMSEEVPTDSEQIVVTSGAQQGISLVTSELVRPGDAVVTEDATYAGALDAFRAAGARLFGARTDENGVDVTDLEQVVARVRPALIYLVATHNNPRGTVLPPHRREAVVDIARRYHVPVLDDMSLSQLHLDPDAVSPPPLAHYAETGPASRRTDLVLSVDSVAKACWGGLRIGWVRSSPGMANRLAKAKGVDDLGSPPVMQLVAARLVEGMDGVLARRNEILRRQYADITAELATQLPDWEYVAPRGGPVLWVKLPVSTVRGFTALAMRHGVTVAQGPAFSPVEGFADHLRLPFGGPPEERRRGIDRLAAAWAAYEPDREVDRMPARPLL